MTTDTESEATPESHDSQGLAEPDNRPAHWFRAGDPRASEAGKLGGRPRKGQSAQEKLVAHVNRDADEILAGIVREARKGNTRAFIALWDRAFGVPKQTLVVERPDDPLTRWIQGMSGIDVVNDVPLLPPPTTE